MTYISRFAAFILLFLLNQVLLATTGPNYSFSTPPQITLIGDDPQIIEVYSDYLELGANASDAEDGTIDPSNINIDTSNLPNGGIAIDTLGDFIVNYTVQDLDGNQTQVDRIVRIVDSTPPVITLLGDDPLIVEVNSPYIEPGASVSDNFDGNITGTLIINSSFVNTSVVGSYYVTYNITDNASNNAIEVTRTVNVVDTSKPVITIIGDTSIIHEAKTPYNDQGATALDNYDGTITNALNIQNTVNAYQKGTYTVSYNVTDNNGNEAIEKIRTVNVVDTTAPEISLVGNPTVSISEGATYNDAGVTAFDNYDGNITSSVIFNTIDTSIIGPQIIYYDVTDASGNNAIQVTRTVTVNDNTIPEITLQGSNPLYLNQNETFNEPGYSAIDNFDGDLTQSVNVTGFLDTATTGTYTKSYNVSDSSGNIATQKTRTVIVNDNTAPIISLVGNPVITVDEDSSFTDPGATAVDNFDGNIDPANISALTNLDINTPGNYIITYNTQDNAGNSATPIERVVVVNDITPPEITLLSDNPLNINQNSPYNEAGASVIDNKDGNISNQIQISGVVDNTTAGTYYRFYNITDASGNNAVQQIRTINVVDTTAPIITIIGDAEININQGSIYTDIGATAIDNFDGDISSDIVTSNPVDTGIIGSYAVTYQVSDSQGIAAIPKTRIVNVIDTTPPVLSLVGSSPTYVTQFAVYNEQGATATDNNDNISSSAISITGNVDETVAGSYTVYYNVSDNAGNAATEISRTVIVTDAEAPVITLSGADYITINQGGTYSEPGYFVSDNVDSNLTGLVSVIESPSLDTNTVGTYVLSYNVTDSEGNNAITVQRTIEVIDITPPVITLIGTNSITIAEGANFSDPGATATDDVDGNIPQSSIVITGNVNNNQPGTYYRYYDVTDNAGNNAIQQQREIIVQDASAPAITLFGDLTVNLDEGENFVEPGFSANDNIDGNITSQVNVDNSELDINTVGSYTIYYNVSDTAGNNAITQTRTVNVNDITPPVITLLGSTSVVINQGGNFNESGFDATDNVDGDISSNVSITNTLNNLIPGSYTITYNVNDSAGNSASPRTRTITVLDNTAPVISLIGNSVININEGDTFIDPGTSATDNVDGNISASVTNDANIIDTSIIGSYTITYNVVDSAGNNAIAVQRTLNVLDNTPPIISLIGNTVTINQGATFIDPQATVTDNYDTGLNFSDVVVDTSNLNVNVPGTYNIFYDVEDAQGNQAITVVRTVIVSDNEPPVISLAGNSSITITLGTTFIDPGAAAFDNVDGTIPFSSFNVSGNVDSNTIDVYTLSYNVNDSSGNAATTVTRTVQVVNNNPPTITLIGDANVTVNQGETFTDPGISATDDIDGDITASITIGGDAVNTAIPAVYIITYNVTDSHGNFAPEVTRTVTVLDTEKPVITLLNDNPYDINEGSNYIDPGYSASDNVDGNITANVIVDDSNLDTNSVGSYSIFYNVGDFAGNAADTKTRIVNVLDITPPVINLVGSNSVTINQGETYNEQGATALDNVDGTIPFSSFSVTGNVDNTSVASYNLTYNVSDNAGNSAVPVTRVVDVLDITAPALTLIGDALINLGQNDVYTEQGASAIDDVDGDISANVVITGNVDTSIPDTYIITYNISDSAGNAAPSITRTVIVEPLPEPGNNFGPLVYSEDPIYQGSSNITVSINPITHADSHVWTVPAGVTIVSGQGTNSITIDISETAVSGTIEVYGQNSIGAGAPLSVTLSIESIPDANAGNNRAICLNETTQLGDVANPGSSYQWTSVPNDPSISDPFISNPFVSPTVSTIYTLTETGLNGGVNSNDVEIVVNPLPNASVIADATVCENSSIAIGAPAVGGHSYSWSSIPAGFNSTQANPTLTATELTVTREYILTETIDVTGCQNQNSVIITVEELPSINAGPPSDTICASQTTYVLDQATGPINNVTYSWTAIGSNGSFTPSANVLNPTFSPDPQDILNGSVVLRLVATATGNCSASPVQSELQLLITPEPTASAGSDVTICSNDTYQINGTSTNGNINWTSSGSANTLDAYNINNPIYTPSPQDIIDGFVNLTMTVAPLTPCSSNAVSVIKITLTEEPEITINSDFIICEDQNVSLTSTITNTSQIIWSTPGDGVFIPENGLNTQNPVYDPGPLDIQNGNIILTVSATGIGECAAATTDQTLVTIVGNPLVDAGTAGSMCEGINPLITASATNYATLLWESPGGGIFSDETIPNPTYEPSAAELSNGTATLRLTATPLTPCGITVVDEVTYSVFPAPQVNAGGDFEICESDNLSFPITTSSASNYESIQWTSSTGGTFNFDNIEQPTYFPSQTDVTNGSVQLTITATQGSCADVSDDMVLTIVKKPTVEAGNDITICQGETAFINAILTDYESVTWTRMGGNGLSIDFNTPNPRYESTPTDVGPIMLTCEVQPKSANGTPCGSPVTDFMRIFIEPAPQADAGADQTICEGEDFQFTPGSVTASNFSNITWTSVGDNTGIFTLSEANDLSPTYTPGNDAIAAGFVFLRLTAFPNAPCALPIVAEMKLNITKVPVVDAGNDLEFCETTGPFTITDASADFYDELEWTTSGNGTWSTPNNLESVEYVPTNQDIAAGQITLTFTARRLPTNCGAAVSDTKIITFIKEPIAFAGDDVIICDANTYTITDALVTNQSNIIWDTSGDGSFFPNNNVQNPEYRPGVNDIADGIDIQLTVTAVPTAPCGVSMQDTMIISLEQTPTVELGAPFSICEDSTHQFSLTDGIDVTGTTALTTYSWSSNGDGAFSNKNILNPVYTPGPNEKLIGASSILTLSVNAGNNCVIDQQDTVIVTIVKNPEADAGPPLTICETGITITDASANHFNSLEWEVTNGTGSITQGTLNPTYVPSATDILNNVPIILRLTATSNNPCNSDAVSEKTITIQKTPVVEAGIASTICEGSSFTLNGNVENGLSYEWTSTNGGTFDNPTSSLTPEFTPSNAEILAGQAIVNLTALPIAPCSGPITDQVIIPIQQNIIIDAGSDLTVCESETEIVIDGVSLQNHDTFAWSSPTAGSFTSSNLNTTYEPSPADYNNGSVLLTLTAQPISPCTGAVTDTKVITFTKEASVTLNPTNATICENQSYTFAAGTVSTTNTSSISWTRNGDGNFDFTDIENPTYTPGLGDIINGTVTLTVSVDAQGTACNNPTDTKDFVLNIDKLPTLDITNTPTQACYGTDLTLSVNAANYNTIFWEVTSGTGSITAGANTLTPTYTPDTDSDSVEITVTAQPVAPCATPVSETVIINVTQLPEITSFQADASSCGNALFQINNVTTNGLEYETEWITSGTGDFSATLNVLNPTYEPSNADINNGSVTLTLRAKADQPCVTTDDAVQSFVLTLSKEPLVFAGNDDTVCEDGTYTVTDATYDFAASIPPSADFSWTSNSNSGVISDANSMNPSYTPGPVDIANGYFELTFTVQGETPCGTTSDTKRVDIILNPTVEVGPDQLSCENEPYQISGVIVNNANTKTWTSTTGGSFSDPATNNPIYFPTPQDLINGSVILTLEVTANSPCTTSESDFFRIVFEEKPIVFAGPPATICEDGVFSLAGTASNNSSISWDTSGNGTFNLSNNTYIPGSDDKLTGSVDLTLTAFGIAACADESSTMTLTITKKPVITIGSDLTLCEGDVIQINDVFVNNSNTYSWIASGSGLLTGGNTLNPTYTPGANEIGPVTLTLTAESTAPCSGNVVAVKTLNYIEAPVVFAGNDYVMCENEVNYEITDATISGVYNTSEWTKETGTGSFSTNNIVTTYTPSPSDFANGFVELKLTAVTNSSCANDSDIIRIDFIRDATANIPLTSASFCNDESYTITGSTIGPNATFNWISNGTGSFNGTNSTLTPTYTPGVDESGIVIITLNTTSTSQCATTASDQMTLLIEAAPLVTIDASTQICDNTSYTFSNSEVLNTSAFTWNTNASGPFTNTNSLNPTYTPSADDLNAGSVQFELIAIAEGACNNNASASMTITFTNATSGSGNIIGDASFCEDSGVHQYQIFNINNATNYFWQIAPAASTQINNGQGTDTVEIEIFGNGDYVLSATPSNDCGAGTAIEYNITVLENDFLNLTTANDTNQIVCEGIAIADIKYDTNTTVTGIAPTGLPDGVNASLIGNEVIISGIPINVTNQTVYNYDITTFGSGCTPTSVQGSITVNPEDIITLSSLPGSDNQVNKCEGDLIDPITYSIGGDATSAVVTWDAPNGQPTGVTFDPASLTISGNLNNDISFQTTYSYTITTTGSNCPVSQSGSITVNPDDELTLNSLNNNQTICETGANIITPINYTIGGGATSAAVTWNPVNGQPSGINFNPTTLTIEGTFNGSVSSPTVYEYEIVTNGNCITKLLTGSITVNPDDEISLVSAVGSDNQNNKCEGNTIDPITYSIAGDATGAIVNWDLPNGQPVGVSFNSASLTISGNLNNNISTPTIYSYTITTTGGTCPVSKTGNITVNPNDELTLTSSNNNQTICETGTNAITPINYSIGGGATSAAVTWDPVNGQPSGIIFDAASLTLSGTFNGSISTETIYSYTITTNGGCQTMSSSGNISIKPDDELELNAPFNNNQNICEGDSISSISYSVGGGTNSASIEWDLPNGEPSGILFNPSTMTISGQITTNVNEITTYSYTITTNGSCTNQSASGAITVNPNDELTLTSSNNNQTICETGTNAITPINYSIGGGATSAAVTWDPVNGQPSGINFNPSTLSIEGAFSGNINTPTVYEYEIITNGSCVTTSLNGSIIVNPDDEINLVSPPGTNNQFLCEGDPLLDISYALAGGATAANINWDGPSGQPAGVIFNPSTLTISGNLITNVNQITAYNYTISTTGICNSVSTSGIITVSPNDELTLVSSNNNQTICETGTSTLDPIVYTIGGGATSVSISWDAPNGQPSGINFDLSTFTLSGTFNGSISTETNYSFTLTTNGGCQTMSSSGNITIKPDDELALNPPFNNNQTICEGGAITPITYTVGGGTNGAIIAWDLPSGEPSGIIFNPSTMTISGQVNNDVSEITTYTYTITTNGSCTKQNASGNITVNPDGEFVNTTNNQNQTICEGDPISDIIYQIAGGATSATVNALPNGLNFDFPTTNTIRIYGTPSDNINTTTVVGYDISTTGSGSCNEENLTGAITVNQINTIVFDAAASNFNSSSPIVCEGETLDLKFNLGDGATNASVIGLPDGLTVGVNTGVFTIGGTLSTNETSSKTYNYQITTSGSECPEIFDGQIVVNPDHKIELSSIGGSDSQSFCENTPMPVNIEYLLSEGATNYVITGLPSGLQHQLVGNTITISGTPNESITQDQVFNYTITTTGNTCVDASISGSITLFPDSKISLSSLPSTINQEVCETGPNTSIATIIYTLSEGATSYEIFDLPNGLTHTINASNEVVISGIVSESVTTPTSFNYSILAYNANGCSDASLGGLIIVNPSSEINLISSFGSDNQTLCELSPITPIQYELLNTNTASIAPGTLPLGVDYEITGSTLTISGIPEVSGIFNYTITTSNNNYGCDETSISGSIEVDPIVPITLASGSGLEDQIICEEDTIDKITYDIGLPNIPITVSGLPQGVFFEVINDQVIIQGFTTIDITSTQVFNYTVETNNQNCDNLVSGSITINPDDNALLMSALGTDQQIVCQDDSISDIVYSLSEGTLGANVSGLPVGVSYTATLNELIISGAATDNAGIYNYTVTTFGSCAPKILNGSIEINSSGSIVKATNSGQTTQTICQFNSFDDIIFNITNAITANVTGLPDGLSFNIQEVTGTAIKRLTISGSPNVIGVFPYEVKTLGGCESTFNGIISVNDGAFLSLTSDVGSDQQVICEYGVIDTITYQVIGNTNEIASIGLPPGMSAVFNAADNSVTVNGSYNGAKLLTVQDFDYTIFSVSNCPAEIEGTITIYPTVEIANTENVTVMSTNPTNTQVKNILCNGDGDGEINIVVNGGSPSANYIVEWTGPNNYTNSILNIKNLAVGSYDLTITDTGSNNCQVSASYEILEADPIEIQEINTIPPSCETELDDGEIQINVTGGSDELVNKINWYKLDESNNCYTFSITPINNDNDGIPDYADANIDGDSIIDPGKTDTDGDGIFDLADADSDGDGTIDSGLTDNNDDGINDNYSIGIVSYQLCDTGNNFTNLEIFNGAIVNNTLSVCAKQSTISLIPNFDHDINPDTADISAFTLSGGTSSCSTGQWSILPDLAGNSFITNLADGIYKVIVTDEDFNGNIFCSNELNFELTRDAINYGNISVEDTLCNLESGSVIIDLLNVNGELFFYYNNSIISNTNVDLISSDIEKDVYQIFIANPVPNGVLEIINEFGCGTIVDQSLLNFNLNEPDYTFTSPEYEEYGIISKRSFVEFQVLNFGSYTAMQWDFGDSSGYQYGSNVSHQFVQSGTYDVVLTVTNAAGCSSSITKTLTVDDGYSIMIPNVFSPNGDNINDLYRPLFNGIKSIIFNIYDQSGNLMYTEEGTIGANPNIQGISIKGWDGSNAYNSSSYFEYKIQAVLINDETVTKTGIFKILR